MAKSIRDNVRDILEQYPETRNSDKLLILKYWELVDKLPMHSMSRLKEAFVLNSTSTESIRRARQLIQESGEFLPTNDNVVKRRRRREQKMFEAITKHGEVV